MIIRIITKRKTSMKKKIYKLLILPTLIISLSSCDLFDDIFGGDNDNIHSKSYEPITGKFYLHEAADKRFTYENTYFDIDGSAGNFSLKYYENGALKKEGVFNKIVTRQENIGLKKDNLHFNIKTGDTTEHISSYTESLDPIDQFRIIEEYTGSDKRYFLSELPFVMGTYVREGKTYKEESPVTGEDQTSPSRENFTSELNGTFKLDDDHYFYFVYPNINDYYAKAYFQYYSPTLEKPLEGFASGKTYTNLENIPTLVFTYSREVLIYTANSDASRTEVRFGYYTVGEDDRLTDHPGSVDFSNNKLNSFTFEHLSRNWTDEEMDEWTKNIDYKLPDPIYYDYIGGTYLKA